MSVCVCVCVCVCVEMISDQPPFHLMGGEGEDKKESTKLAQSDDFFFIYMVV